MNLKFGGIVILHSMNREITQSMFGDQIYVKEFHPNMDIIV